MGQVECRDRGDELRLDQIECSDRRSEVQMGPIECLVRGSELGSTTSSASTVTAPQSNRSGCTKEEPCQTTLYLGPSTSPASAVLHASGRVSLIATQSCSASAERRGT